MLCQFVGKGLTEVVPATIAGKEKNERSIRLQGGGRDGERQVALLGKPYLKKCSGKNEGQNQFLHQGCF